MPKTREAPSSADRPGGGAITPKSVLKNGLKSRLEAPTPTPPPMTVHEPPPPPAMVVEVNRTPTESEITACLAALHRASRGRVAQVEARDLGQARRKDLEILVRDYPEPEMWTTLGKFIAASGHYDSANLGVGWIVARSREAMSKARTWKEKQTKKAEAERAVERPKRENLTAKQQEEVLSQARAANEHLKNLRAICSR
jgi:hypothetical protein